MNQIHVRRSLLVAFAACIAFVATPVLADYTTEVKVYLDVGAGAANDTRFDFTSAISHPDDDPEDGADDPNDGICAHARDFAFNCGFYDDTDLDAPGAGTDRFICSASNTTGRGNSFPKNPARDPIAISATGWYTLKHTFRDDGGVLAVDLEIIDSSSTVLNTWTLSEPTDVIGVFIGGNRYGWFPANEFSFLAIDDSQRCSGSCPFVQDFEVDALLWETPVRVSSGTNGIASAVGSFHAEATGDFTRWGGYECVFPTVVTPLPAGNRVGLAGLALLLMAGIAIAVVRRHGLGV